MKRIIMAMAGLAMIMMATLQSRIMTTLQLRMKTPWWQDFNENAFIVINREPPGGKLVEETKWPIMIMIMIMIMMATISMK